MSLEEADLLIQDCTMLTMDDKQPIIEKGFLAIKDKQIMALGKKTKASSMIKAEKTISGVGKVAMPGLINCHTHVAMTLFRGIAEDKPLDTWLRKTIWPLEANLKPKHVYDGTLLGCLEMIKSGTTCFCDMYFHEEMVAKAVEKAGLRAVLSEGIIEAGDSARGENMLKDSVNIVKRFNGYADGRVSARLGPHALYSCSPNLLRRIREYALKLNIGVHMHLAESPDLVESLKSKYGLDETELLEKIGFLKDLDLLAAHCIYLSDPEMSILAGHGVKVVYNPVANMKLGVDAAKINDLLKLGVIVGLGTDGPASNNSLDMFETMKVGALFQKSSNHDPTILPTETVLRMATIDGARALGLEKQVGSLEIGKKADIILIDFEKPHLTPQHNLYANIVYSARGSDVDTVIVDGKILMEKRKVRTAKEKEVMERAQRTASSLVGSSLREM
jgi:5-methylthioadenosine/S-adenosylhomocysteine deaminase